MPGLEIACLTTQQVQLAFAEKLRSTYNVQLFEEKTDPGIRELFTGIAECKFVHPSTMHNSTWDFMITNDFRSICFVIRPRLSYLICLCRSVWPSNFPIEATTIPVQINTATEKGSNTLGAPVGARQRSNAKQRL